MINKTMDRDDLCSPEAQRVVGEINDLVRKLTKRRLKISSWYGTFDLVANPDPVEKINRGPRYTPLEGAADDANFPWFLYWEIVWIVLHNEFIPGMRVLDLGGSSSLFSYYLASKGLQVTTVELNRVLVENADHVAAEMGWNLKNYVMDMRSLDLEGIFDHITSICVYEHIPVNDRISLNRRLHRFLPPGGRFSITFDYRNPSRTIRISSWEEVEEQFIRPSGLSLRGDGHFRDSGKNYLLHPFYASDTPWTYRINCLLRGHFPLSEMLVRKEECDYTFAALFLEKR